ncbi:hypothetical protein Rcae01_00172 [Novipirellula caenicola]|uniref:Uncharacterized protein n=1 Tax=Novipirellula caenicola TaxID=1536901 RepID=A0ABP9VHP8_9BACT
MCRHILYRMPSASLRASKSGHNSLIAPILRPLGRHQKPDDQVLRIRKKPIGNRADPDIVQKFPPESEPPDNCVLSL